MSFIGFYDADGPQVVSIFCGFFTIFIGVYLLNSGKGNTEQELGSPRDRDASGNSSIPLKSFDEEEERRLNILDDEDDM
jgi:hypothetical protein